MKRLAYLCLVVCVASSDAEVVYAQGAPVASPETEQPGQAAERALEQLERSSGANLQERLGGFRRVTYAEVLSDPDNLDLNYRWVLTQIQDGNLKGAAATLERMLLVRPKMVRMRMLYAVVLLKMGDFEHAQRELELLEPLPMNARSRAQLKGYQDQIRRNRKVYRSVLTLNVGAQTDSNRNSGPDSNQALVGNIRQSVGAASKKTADQGFSSILNLQVERDLGSQEDLKAVAGLTYFHAQQEDLENLDLQVAKFDLGFRLRRSGWELQPQLVADAIDLSREVYQRSFGAQLLGKLPLSNKLDLSMNLRSVYEDYDSTPDATTARDRSGYRTDFKLDLGFRPRLDQRLTFKAGVSRKSAQKTYFSLLGWQAGLNHLWVLPTGQFLISSVNLKREKYHRNQNSIGESRRRDFQTTAGLTLGIPLNSLWSQARMLRGMSLTLNTEVVHSRSNLPNNEYKNLKFGVSLTKRFEL